MSNFTEASSIGSPGCRRCALAPRRGQLRFFDDGPFVDESRFLHDGAVILDEGDELGWPSIETSHCGRVGFWLERTPAVFGTRVGVGPLLVMPDTNILIGIREQLDEVEGALIIHPLWSARETLVDALRDLVQLWWWRDLRFVVGPQHLEDSRKPLSPERMQAREDAVRELEQDFRERGGHQAVVHEEALTDEPCPVHCVPCAGLDQRLEAATHWRWPRDDLDRALVEAAYDAGCHVFLTADKGVLKSHASLFSRGLAVLSPGQLLAALDDSGELDGTRGGNFLLPDLSTLSRLYAGFSD